VCERLSGGKEQVVKSLEYLGAEDLLVCLILDAFSIRHIIMCQLSPAHLSAIHKASIAHVATFTSCSPVWFAPHCTWGSCIVASPMLVGIG
jgi:hypothetical protein